MFARAVPRRGLGDAASDQLAQLNAQVASLTQQIIAISNQMASTPAGLLYNQLAAQMAQLHQQYETVSMQQRSAQQAVAYELQQAGATPAQIYQQSGVLVGPTTQIAPPPSPTQAPPAAATVIAPPPASNATQFLNTGISLPFVGNVPAGYVLGGALAIAAVLFSLPERHHA